MEMYAIIEPNEMEGTAPILETLKESLDGVGSMQQLEPGLAKG